MTIQRVRCDGASEDYFIYFIYDPSMHAVKIGHTTNPERRLAAFQTGNAAPLRLVGKARCASQKIAQEGERHYHAVFADARISGEWFSLHHPLLQELVDWYERDHTLCGECQAPV